MHGIEQLWVTDDVEFIGDPPIGASRACVLTPIDLTGDERGEPGVVLEMQQHAASIGDLRTGTIGPVVSAQQHIAGPMAEQRDLVEEIGVEGAIAEDARPNPTPVVDQIASRPCKCATHSVPVPVEVREGLE